MFKNKVLLHRIPRIFKASAATFIALTLVVGFLTYAVTTYSARTEIIAKSVRESAQKNNVEDGFFEAAFKLTTDELKQLQETNVDVQENFSVTINVGDSKLRVFKIRERIDKVDVDNGTNPRPGEIVVEKLYAKAHDLNIGSIINVGGKDYKVSGTGSSPDYDRVKENLSDLTSDEKQFGTAFVCAEDFNTHIATCGQGQAMQYNYAFKFQQEDDGLFKSILDTFTYDARLSTDTNLTSAVNEWYEPINKAQNDVDSLANASQLIRNGTTELNDGAEYLSEQAKSSLAYIQTHSQEVRKDIDYAFQNVNKLLDFCSDDFIDSLVVRGILTKEQADSLKITTAKARTELNNFDELYTDLVQRLNQLSDDALAIVQQQNQGLGRLNDSIELLDQNIQSISSKIHKAIDTYAVINLPKAETYTLADNNSRIMASVKTQDMIMKIIPVIQVFIFLIMAYILSIFIKDLIDKEKVIIGTMAALGIKKRDIILPYLLLPVIVCVIGSVIGIIIGASPFGAQASIRDTANTYSFPEISQSLTVPVILEALFIPIIIVTVVNFLFINNSLSKPCLDLLNNKTKFRVSKVPEFISNMKFDRAFQLGQIIRHKSNAVIIFFGLFICMIFLMMGLDVAALCENNIDHTKQKVGYEYQYFLNHTSKTVPENSRAYFGSPVHLNKNTMQTVIVLGIEDNDNIKVSKNKNSITLNKDLAEKWKYKIGDTVVISATNNSYEAAFVVENIVDEFYGFYAFIYADNLRYLVDAEQNTYNIYFSKDKLDFDESAIATLVSKDEMVEAASEYLTDNYSTILQFTLNPTIVFILIIYLLTSILLKKCTLPISTMKLFGYKNRELYRFYLKSNFYMVFLFSVILLPICKALSEIIYLQFTEKLNFNPDYTYSP